MNTIRYAIADDHKIFRQGLRYALADDHALKFVGEAENGRALLSLIEKQRPNVVLMDLKMPEMDGEQATVAVKKMFPETKVLILTSYDDENLVLHLLETGANGYLLKNTEPDEIKNAIHTVHNQEHYFSNMVSSAMLRAITRKNTAATIFKTKVVLTEREKEVLQLICKEKTTNEIAATIFLSARTVEGIRTTLIEKTGARNTAGLVLYAMRTKLID